MKKVLLLVGLLFFALSLGAETIIVYEGNGNVYVDMLEMFTDRDYVIVYDTESDQYYFYSSDGFLTSGWIFLGKGDIQKIRKTLEKWLDWEKIAIKNKKEIEKEIPDSKIKTKVNFKWGDDFYTGSGLTMAYTFFSQNTTRHQLLIQTNEVSASTNEFIDYSMDTFYIDNDEVKKFLDGISEKSIAAAIAKATEKKKDEDLFQ